MTTLNLHAEIDLIEVFYVATLYEELAPSPRKGVAVPQAARKRKALESFLGSGHSRRRTGTPSTLSRQRAEGIRAQAIEDITILAHHLNEEVYRSVLVGDLRAVAEDSNHWQGRSPLMVAARAGAVKCLHYLLSSFPDLSVMDHVRWTPLHHACGRGNYEAARVLIQRGAHVNSCSGVSLTPICVAAMRGCNSIITLLLEAGANVDGCAEFCRSGAHGSGCAAFCRFSPLYWACGEDHHNTVILLVEKGADVNYGASKQMPLERALQYGSAALVSTLLDAGALTYYIHKTCWIDLRMAAENGSRDVWLDAAQKLRLLEAAADGMDANVLAHYMV